MLFRSSDLLADFERLTRGLNLNADLEKFDLTNLDLTNVVDGLTSSIQDSFTAPGIDAVRTAKALELHIDLPGVDPSSVDLTVDGRAITVAATRDFTVADDAELTHAGRRHGSFTRTFRLTDDLDTEGLTARSEHGVLVVTIPVAASAQPRKVEITS